nr:uncharacterized protein LOC129523917 [Gorilla gorilla gorilla]
MVPGPWGGVGGGWGPRDEGWGRQLLAAGPRPVAVGLCGGGRWRCAGGAVFLRGGGGDGGGGGGGADGFPQWPQPRRQRCLPRAEGSRPPVTRLPPPRPGPGWARPTASHLGEARRQNPTEGAETGPVAPKDLTLRFVDANCTQRVCFTERSKTSPLWDWRRWYWHMRRVRPLAGHVISLPPRLDWVAPDWEGEFDAPVPGWATPRP